MKTLKTIIRTCLSPSGITAAALLLGASVQTSHAGAANPAVGGSFTWDLISTGAGERGISFVTFTNDGTFTGYQMLAAIPPKTNAVSNGRGGTTVGRGDSGGTGTTVQTFLFGFSPIKGTWTIDSHGRIIGFFDEALNVTSVVTNYAASSGFVTLTNPQLTTETTNVFVSYTNGQASAKVTIPWPDPPPGFNQDYTLLNPSNSIAIGSAESTNIVSFVGTSVLGKKLTLICTTTFGKVTFKGVPAVKNVDISGNWIGAIHHNGITANELFSLTAFSPSANPFPTDFPDIANFPNLFFTTNGLGAGYTFGGVAMVSQQKTVGFTITNSAGTLRAVIGTLKPTRFGTTATTKGVESPLNAVDFSATLQ